MNLETLRAFELVVKKEIPSFNVRFKDESKLMSALGVLVRPFNPSFMKTFTTTLGSTVYFPTRARYEAEAGDSVVTLAHEFVHLYDNREVGIKFQIEYAIPQAIALPLFVIHCLLGSPLPLLGFLVGYVVLALVLGSKELGSKETASKSTAGKLPLLRWLPIVLVGVASVAASVVLTGWWSLVLLGGLACLGPWPSSGRTHWEMRGYTMNLAIYVWVRNALLPDSFLKALVAQFTGSSYWFMCRDAKWVESELNLALSMTLERQLERLAPYSVVHAFLARQGVVATAFTG